MRIALQSTVVQTYLTQKIAGILSDKLNTHVTVTGVDLELIRTISLEGVYVEDLKNDTLIYAGYLKGDIGDLNFRENIYEFSEVRLEDATFRLKYYKGDSLLNLQFIIDVLAGEDSAKSSAPATLIVRKLTLENSNFSYDDFNEKEIDFGFDYNHIGISGISTTISEISINGDTISGKIAALNAKEQSGLTLHHFSANATVCPVFIMLNDLKILTAKSDINGDLLFNYNEYPAFYDFLNKVKISANFGRSELNLEDISYFATDLKGIDKKIVLSGSIKGKISRLKGKNLNLQFAPNSFFKGDLAIDGLPNIDETFISLAVKRIETNRRDLETIPVPPFDSSAFLDIPDKITSLGKMSFSGNFTGFINDFVALGKFETALGDIVSDLKLTQDSINKRIHYSGKIATSGFRVGALLEQDTMLGTVAGELTVVGSGMKKENVHMNMRGSIAAFDFNKYRYRDIKVEGELSRSKFNGQLAVIDKNIRLNFDGNIDFEPELPVFNFTSGIQEADLFALHLLTRDSISKFSTNAEINFTGDAIDNIVGSILLRNTKYTEGKNSFELDSIYLQAFALESGKVLKLESDLVDGRLEGNFLTTEIAPSFNHILSHILPSYFEKEIKKPGNQQQFTYYVNISNTEQITKIFAPDLRLDSVYLSGRYNSDDKVISLEMEAPFIKYKKFMLSNFMLDLSSSGDVLTVNSNSRRFNLSDSVWIENVDLVFKLTNDQVQFGYSWQNEPGESGTHYRGSINGLANIYKNNKFGIRFFSSEIVLADSVWSFGNNEIFIDSSSIDFKNFIIKNSEQEFAIDGKISEDENDELKVFLKNFDLKNINILTAESGLYLGGIINGTATVSKPYTEILFNSNLAINDLAINGDLIGKGEFVSVYNTKEESIRMNGFLGRENNKMVLLEGYYFPEKKADALDLTATISDFNLALLSPYTVDIVSKIKGRATGTITVKGSADAPELAGKVDIDSASFLFDYLNTFYTLPKASIVIEKNWIGFNNVAAKDVFGNSSIVTGTIVHNNFKNFNLDISIDAKNFQALNTNAMLNSLYYGKAYLTGFINISGTTDNLVFDINGKSEKGTEFFIPLSGPAEVSEQEYIQFVSKGVVKKTAQKEYEVNLSGIQLNFKLEITPDARIELIFDETAGDIIKARGNGNLMLEINTLGNFNMYGEYIVSEGDYLFTLENIINKKFIVEDGGTITWNGNPYDAQLDLDAVYKLRAPLSDITGDSTLTKRVPVETHMLMTGKLMNPDIKFDIKLPSVPEEVRSRVLTNITTEQDMNKQVFSLLIMNRFYPEQGGVSTGEELTSTSASELLSNQLSNWLSQTTDIVNLGVSYRSGDAVTTQEVELALSKQLFNDRISIEGNVGVGGTSTAETTTGENSGLVGDVNVEYKISDDGRFRAKMFNESNDYNLANANQSPYTQGVGIFYREEFNTFSEFFQTMFRRKKKEKTSEEKANGNGTGAK